MTKLVNLEEVQKMLLKYKPNKEPLDVYFYSELMQGINSLLTYNNDPIESQWIDVKERLPEQAGEYLVFDPEDSLISDYFINREWQYTKPTYWQPLPLPPK